MQSCLQKSPVKIPSCPRLCDMSERVGTKIFRNRKFGFFTSSRTRFPRKLDAYSMSSGLSSRTDCRTEFYNWFISDTLAYSAWSSWRALPSIGRTLIQPSSSWRPTAHLVGNIRVGNIRTSLQNRPIIRGCYRKKLGVEYILITRSTSWVTTGSLLLMPTPSTRASTRLITAKATADLLEEDFGHFEYPHTLVSENAPVFMSQDFHTCCKERGIVHLTGAPYHPATNGAAEKLVQSFKQSLKKSNLPPKAALQEFLMQYRRTPLESGYSPCELLNKRQIRCKIDSLIPSPAHMAQGRQSHLAMKSQEGEKTKTVSKVTLQYAVGAPCYALYCGPRRDKGTKMDSSRCYQGSRISISECQRLATWTYLAPAHWPTPTSLRNHRGRGSRRRSSLRSSFGKEWKAYRRLRAGLLSGFILLLQPEPADKDGQLQPAYRPGISAQPETFRKIEEERFREFPQLRGRYHVPKLICNCYSHVLSGRSHFIFGTFIAFSFKASQGLHCSTLEHSKTTSIAILPLLWNALFLYPPFSCCCSSKAVVY